jgi:hypothetical protein
MPIDEDEGIEKFKWTIVGGGAVRFHGKKAMALLVGLLHNDPSYTLSIPTGWPAPFWIDVYPTTVQDREFLIELIGAA